MTTHPNKINIYAFKIKTKDGYDWAILIKIKISTLVLTDTINNESSALMLINAYLLDVERPYFSPSKHKLGST